MRRLEDVSRTRTGGRDLTGPIAGAEMRAGHRPAWSAPRLHRLRGDRDVDGGNTIPTDGSFQSAFLPPIS